MGSQSRRPTRVPLLTALHKALLLSWARQHYHWTVDYWKRVAWSDESRFQLYQTETIYALVCGNGGGVPKILYRIDARVRVWRQHH
ncbi:hypothetical protein AVEN_10512-1 [Araneus ventricosus]|uniref:Transposase Tc1-like domain-containing protein n=1 Tax=Araneus ventricosus TaxID=182803 RepID=A0A4Y2JGU2_ARAVE|nr:hypothetical protein AVEN_10512-1 [Araneus ventricosus]